MRKVVKNGDHYSQSPFRLKICERSIGIDTQTERDFPIDYPLARVILWEGDWL